MTTRARRAHVFLGVLGCLSLALVLVAEAAAAPSSAQSNRKRRAAWLADEEFGIQPTAWLTLRPVWLAPGAGEKPPAAPRLAAETVVIESRAGTTPRRGGHGSANIPKVVPPFPGPASPIR